MKIEIKSEDNDPIEWEFTVPASQVDMQRIWFELSKVNVFARASYLVELKLRAPVTFGLYCDYVKLRMVSQ